MIGVLIVDDDADLLEILQGYLPQQEFRVDLAGCGQEALDMYSPDRHQVVLSDVQMPGMDGFELFARLKQADDAVSVVFMTGQPSLEGRACATAGHTFGYLAKPFALASLAGVLRQATHAGQVQRMSLMGEAV